MKSGVIIVEDLLKKILAGQELMGQQINTLIENSLTTRNQLNTLTKDVQTTKIQLNALTDYTKTTRSQLNTLTEDIKAIKGTVNRIELHLEETIMGILTYVKAK